MNISQAQFINILESARFAPSVHNTQPWKVSLEPDFILVSLDADHLLGAGDPTGRQTIISLGIFLEAISIAALAEGLDTEVISFSSDNAKIYLKAGSSGSKNNREVTLLKKRSTDRSIYSKVAIPGSLEQSIKSAVSFPGTNLYVVTDEATIKQIALFTSKGISLALSNPAFRKELSQYLVQPWSHKKRGISLRSLSIPMFIAILQPLMIRLGWANSQEVRLELKRWESSSAVIIITGKGDLSKYWFDAGRAYLRASLAIEASGLSQATSAAIVEASDFHEDVEALLGTHDRILAILRVGKGLKNRKSSPRLTAQEMATSN